MLQFTSILRFAVNKSVLVSNFRKCSLFKKDCILSKLLWLSKCNFALVMIQDGETRLNELPIRNGKAFCDFIFAWKSSLKRKFHQIVSIPKKLLIYIPHDGVAWTASVACPLLHLCPLSFKRETSLQATRLLYPLLQNFILTIFLYNIVYFQVSSRNRSLYSRQSSSKSMSGVQTQEMPGDGDEQRRWVPFSVSLFIPNFVR